MIKEIVCNNLSCSIDSKKILNSLSVCLKQAKIGLIGPYGVGKTTRAAMAGIFMGDNPPQLVMLDEPTNNMDLESINALESALSKYQGALLVVSHDKLFLENIGVEVYVSLGAEFKQIF